MVGNIPKNLLDLHYKSSDNIATVGNIPKKLLHYMSLDNIAPELDKDYLAILGTAVNKSAETDKASRSEWFDQYNKAKTLISREVKQKSWPWDKASNVIIPILKTAIIQFNASTNPTIIKGEDVVKVSIMKEKPSKSDDERAKRISSHMSYQLVGASDQWRIGTDKLLSNLGLAGVTFRKTFYDPVNECPKSIFCDPESIYIDNDIESLEEAQRITHSYHLTMNEIMERMKAGIFSEFSREDLMKAEDGKEVNMDELQETLEQHTYLDLDDDGYKEPYTVTIHKKTSKIFRIVARFDEDSFVFKNGRLIRINEVQSFTDFHLIPNPDGSFWSWGFSDLLYHLNKSANSMLNSLIDAATLQNLGGGFISMNARVRKREIKRKMGEYVQVNVPSGSSLAQNIYDTPAANPSPVLFQLLGFINEKSQDVSSVNNLTLGQLPGPNVQPTTIMTLLEQGGKVYNAILTRLHYAFQKEYRKIFNLNKKYLDEYNKYYYQGLPGEVTIEDYRKDDYGIFPVLDPNLDSQSKRLMQTQALQALKEDPGVNKYEINKRMLEALHVQDIDKVLPPPPTPEQLAKMPPSMEEKMAEANLENLDLQNELAAAHRNYYVQKPELEALKLHLEELKFKVSTLEKAAKIAKDKIASAIALDKTEAVLGENSVKAALETTERLAQINEPSDIEQRIGQLEEFIGQGMKPIQQGAPQGGQQPQQGPTQGPPQEPPPEIPPQQEG